MADRKRVVRNVIVFVVVTVGVGWLAIGLNAMAGSTDPEQSPGMLLWLVLPLIVSLLLRLLGGDGWRDLGFAPSFRGNQGWYALSILAYPIGILLSLAAGSAVGAVSMPGLGARIGALLGVVGVQLIVNLVKNIAEEFAWRGYLTPKLQQVGLPVLANHAIVGLIWSAWHVPYWIGLLDQASLDSFTGLSLPAFVILGVLALLTSSLLYGELKLATGSVWPPMLLHTTVNALSLTLLTENAVLFGSKAGEAVFAPAVGGLLLTVLIALLGWIAYRRRAHGAP